MNNQWFSKIAVWLMIGMVLFTVFKQFDTRSGTSANYLGYSDFLEEVRGKRIKTHVPTSWSFVIELSLGKGILLVLSIGFLRLPICGKSAKAIECSRE